MSKQKDLFDPSQDLIFNSGIQPLAAKMRPKKIQEIVGHDSILGEGTLLRKLINKNHFGSLLFYGPPGVGKTSIAEVIANETQAHFVRINAVMSNVAELRDILKIARYQREKSTVLFIDEIHRFNKSQQDLLLPDVEEGNIRLIGATTQNPGFYINPPLLSRSHLFQLEPLEPKQISSVLKVAFYSKNRGLGNSQCSIDEFLFDEIGKLSDGDLRRALNTLETLVSAQAMGAHITLQDLKVFASERQIRYDPNGDEHYNTASALIKSIRGNDPDAGVYWLAKMLEGGEDPRFIARRLIVSASEDIGLADSRALPVAVATFQACEIIGMPECQINLAHCTVFLATCPKSNGSHAALNRAKREIQTNPVQEIPSAIRDVHTKNNSSVSPEGDYLNSHNYPDNISGQEYLSIPKQFYFPSQNGAEAVIAKRIGHWKELKEKLKKKFHRIHK